MVNLHIVIKNDKFSILYFTHRLQVLLLQSQIIISIYTVIQFDKINTFLCKGLLENRELCRMDNLIEQSQNNNSCLIILRSIFVKFQIFSINSCLEELVGFEKTMSDGLDIIVALTKQCTFSNSIKITQSNVPFPYFIKLYEY